MEVKKIDQTYFLCPFLFVLLCFNFAIICGRLCFTKESVGFSLWAQFQRPPLERSCGKTLGQGIEALPSCQYRAQYKRFKGLFFVLFYSSFMKLSVLSNPLHGMVWLDGMKKKIFKLKNIKGLIFKSLTWTSFHITSQYFI